MSVISWGTDCNALLYSQVEFEGYQRNPDAVLSAKQKVFETVQPDLNVEKGIATYKGIAWTVPGKGVVTAPTVQTAIIK